MWFELVKALPNPDTIDGLLILDEGRERLLSLAKDDDKKNIIRVKNKLEELKEGRGVSEGFDVETVSRNAEILLEQLNEIITGENKKAQTTLSKKLDKILKEQDKEALSKFVGKSVKNMSSKTRKEKVSLLKNNESKIREFIEEDDKDLFYTNNSKLELVAEISQMDTKVESKLETLKDRLKDYPVDIIESDSKVEVKLEDKTPYKQTLEIMDILGLIKAKDFKRIDSTTRGEDVLLFTKKGNYELSPLLEIFGVDSSVKEVKTKVEQEEKKSYQNNVTGDEQVLGYLNFMTSRSIRSKVKFVPEPVVKAATPRKARNHIFGDPPIFSVSLRTIFTRPSFDLSQLTTQAEDQTNEKYISLKIRELLTSSDNITNLDSETLQAIRNSWNYRPPESKNSPKNIKRFINGLPDEQKQLINTYISSQKKTSGSVFTQEEVDFIKNLPSNPNQIKREMNKKFNKEINAKLSIYNDIRKVSDILFKPSQNTFVLNRQTDTKVMKQNRYTEVIKLLMKYKVGETESVTEDLKTTLSDYNKDFVPSRSGAYSPSEMLHYLYLLDLYYGRTGFKKTAISFRNGNTDVDTLIEEAQEKFPQIKEAFMTQVQKKVDDILQNKEKYQKGLTLGRGRGRTKGVRNIFTVLLENDVIKESN